MPSLDFVSFDTTDLRFDRTEAGRKVWVTPGGDGVSLYFFDKPPDLPAGLTSPEQSGDFYRPMLRASPAKLVEVGTTAVSACPAVRLIIKAPQQPHGMTYVGSLTVPFRDFSFVLKAQCQEHETAGVREAVLFDRLLASGRVALNEAGQVSGQWNPDDAQYDAEFPKHPLSRLRALLKRMETTCTVDAETLTQPRFPLP